jgi:hypothetical protein
MPELVQYNDHGQPERLRYQQLPVLMLQELKQLHSEVAALKKEIALLRGEKGAGNGVRSASDPY